MLELLAGAAVAAAALALILQPLTRPAARAVTGGLEPDDPFAPLDESESPKVKALLALKEIDFDRATGKLSDTDYEQLRARYAAQAVAAIQSEDAAAAETPVSVEDAAEALIRSVRARGRACPDCGPRPEADASFCSECGKALQPG